MFFMSICRFWTHIVMAYAFTFWTCYALKKEYATIASMRLHFVASERRRPDQFTVRINILLLLEGGWVSSSILINKIIYSKWLYYILVHGACKWKMWSSFLNHNRQVSFLSWSFSIPLLDFQWSSLWRRSSVMKYGEADMMWVVGYRPNSILF